MGERDLPRSTDCDELRPVYRVARVWSGMLNPMKGNNQRFLPSYLFEPTAKRKQLLCWITIFTYYNFQS